MKGAIHRSGLPPAPAAVWLALTLWLGVALLTACSRPEPVPTMQRLIESEPTQVLQLEDYLEEIAVGPGPLGEEEIGRWRLQGMHRVAEGDATTFQIESVDASLVRYTRWPAGDIAAVEVELPGLGDAQVALLWSRDGESFAANRKVLARPQPGGEIYRFELGDRYAWSGDVRRIQLLPDAEAGVRFRLREIRWIRPLLPPAARDRLVGEAWKVDLGGDLRSALVGRVGGPLEWRVTVPDGGRLHFSYAALEAEGFSADRQFRVIAEVADNEPMVLFDRRLESRDESFKPLRWHDAVIDLSDFAGSEVDLRLVSSSGAGVRADAGLHLWSQPRVMTGRRPTTPPNIVFISLDTLRADHLSLNGYPRRTSPRIDQWAARDAVNFRQTVVQAPWTLPSHVSMLTGIEAYRHGRNHTGSIPADMALATRLRAAGYSTVAITGGAFLHSRHGFDQGFDIFRFWTERTSERELESGLKWTLDRLAEGVPQPFFLFFHTYEIHSPYQARQPYFSQFSGVSPEIPMGILDETGAGRQGQQKRSRMVWRPDLDTPTQPLPEDKRPLVTAYYDSGIAYTDDAIGRLLDALEENGLRQETIVVVTSDHGESLIEHDLAGHGYLYDDNLLVPLLVSYPGRLEGGRVVDHQVRSIDIVPTLLELAGLEIPAELDGRSLVGLSQGPVEHPQTAVTYAPKSNYGLSLRHKGQVKYIFNNSTVLALAGGEAFYDLGRDPGELDNLAIGHLDGAPSSSTSAADEQPGLDIWRQQAEVVLAQVPGVRLHLHNRSNTTWRGTLDGPMLGPKRFKTIGSAGGTAISTGPTSAVFTVDSRATLTLVGEIPKTGTLVIEIAEGPMSDASGPFSGQLEIGPGEIDSWSWSGGSSSTSSGIPNDALFTLSVEWIADPTADSSPIDEDLRRQLAALGYLEVD